MASQPSVGTGGADLNGDERRIAGNGRPYTDVELFEYSGDDRYAPWQEAARPAPPPRPAPQPDAAAGPGDASTPGQLSPQAQPAPTIAGAPQPGAAAGPGVLGTPGQHPPRAQPEPTLAGAPQPGGYASLCWRSCSWCLACGCERCIADSRAHHGAASAVASRGVRATPITVAWLPDWPWCTDCDDIEKVGTCPRCDLPV